ncbi:TIGR01212 family radical SAM protein, partial [bacterium]|nr:TIGR01212 family radical SAM protein [bacterium]
MMRYHAFHEYIKKKYGHRIDRITVNAGMTCPNIDGTKARGGCTFCSDASYEGLTIKEDIPSIAQQIKKGRDYLKSRYPSTRFYVYFQNGTNTYASIPKLKDYYTAALRYPEVVGIMISTRPDCMTDDIVTLLQEFNAQTDVWVELGMPSHREDVNRRLNRAHTNDDFAQAVKKLHAAGIKTCAHVIMGLPGETFEDSKEKALFMNNFPIDAIKIHNMVVFKDTALEKIYASGHYQPLDLQEYTQIAVDFLEHLRPDIVIQRLVAHGPRRLTVAPEWSVNKWNALNAIHAELERLDTWQGKKIGAGR